MKSFTTKTTNSKLIKRLSFALFLVITLLLCTSCDACFHKWEETVVDPTCVDEGKTLRECIKCGKVKEKDIVPALGHEHVATEYEADCDSLGYTEHICYCGDTFVTDVITPVGHQYELTVTEPLCESIGYTTHSCTECGYEYKDSYLSALGHTFQKSVMKPTCVDMGYTTYTCACGFFYKTDFVAAEGHSLTSAVTAPSCLEEGFTTYTCSCGYVTVSDTVAATGHSYEKKVTAPSCLEEGYTTYTCPCGQEYRSDFIAPLGHKLEKKVTMPTCLDEGYTDYSCACGFGYRADPVAPLGHDFTEKVTAPTVSTMGYTTYNCACGYEFIGNYRFYSDILDNAYAGNALVLADGIDVSKYNHPVNPDGSFAPIDWAGLKAEGVDYVILKIGSSLRNGGTKGGLESTFLADYEGAKAAGLDVGVYFFTYATTVEQIREDAKLVLGWLKGLRFEYPIYLDLEDVPKENYYPSQIASPILTEMCLEFFTALQSEGYYTGLYVNNEFLNNILQTENMIELFEIWYARYPTSGDLLWDVEKYGAHLGMWQYSDKGSFDAVPDIPFDLNYAYKDYPTLIKQYGFNGYSTES